MYAFGSFARRRLAASAAYFGTLGSARQGGQAALGARGSLFARRYGGVVVAEADGTVSRRRNARWRWCWRRSTLTCSENGDGPRRDAGHRLTSLPAKSSPIEVKRQGFFTRKLKIDGRKSRVIVRLTPIPGMKPAVPVPEAPEATPAAAEVDAVEAADDDQSAGSRGAPAGASSGAPRDKPGPGPVQTRDKPRFRRRGEGRTVRRSSRRFAPSLEQGPASRAQRGEYSSLSRCLVVGRD